MTKLLALTLFLFTIILISCNRDEKEHKNHNLTEHYFDNASAFQNRYEYDSDIFYYKKELNRSISDTVRIKSLIRLCSIFWWIEMPDSARQYFHESEKVYNNIKNYPHLLSTFLLNKGTYLQKEKEHIRSKLARDSALQIHLSIVLENDTSLSRFYNDLGKSYFFLNKTDSAIIFYNKALLIAKRKDRVDNALLETAYTLGANQRQALWLVFRAPLPAIFSSFRILYDIGWTYVILAEMLNARKGVGYMVEAARKVLDLDRVYAGIIAIGIAAFLFGFLSLTFLEGRLFPWRKASPRWPEAARVFPVPQHPRRPSTEPNRWSQEI